MPANFFQSLQDEQLKATFKSHNFAETKATYGGWASNSFGVMSNNEFAQAEVSTDPTVRTLYGYHDAFGMGENFVKSDIFFSGCISDPTDRSQYQDYVGREQKGGAHIYHADDALVFSIDLEKRLIASLKRVKGPLNTQVLGGGGTGNALRRSAAGKSSGIFWCYFAKGRWRRRGENGNIPAPRAFIFTPGGNWMPVADGELGARALFRMGIQHLLEVLTQFDESQYITSAIKILDRA